MCESIKKVIMERDGLSDSEAQELIDAAQADFDACIENGDMSGAEDICGDYFGLEPDYIEQFI